MTLEPGIYSAAAMGLTGTLTFDAKSDPDAEWTFYLGGALTAAAAAQMVMVGGGNPANVHWVVTGAIALAAGTNSIGSMQSSGAISVGAGSTCGDLEAVGAIGVGASCTVGALKAGGAIAIGALTGYVSATTPAALALGVGSYTV
jgi:hypothetical protein